MRRLKRWLTPGRVHVSGDKIPDGPVLPWGFARSETGDVAVCLPDQAPRLTDVAFVPGAQGSNSHLIGRDRDGSRVRVTLEPLPGQETLLGLRSVLVAVGYGGETPQLITACVEPDGFSAVPLRRQRGDVHSVTVERVIDDGSSTGTWRGMVSVDGRVPNARLGISPSFPIPIGTRIKVIGGIDESDPGKPRFTDESWISNSERLALFGRGMACSFACSIRDGVYVPEALAAIEGLIAECSRLVAQQLGEDRVGTFLLAPLAERTHGEKRKEVTDLRRSSPSSGPAPGLEMIEPDRPSHTVNVPAHDQGGP